MKWARGIIQISSSISMSSSGVFLKQIRTTMVKETLSLYDLFTYESIVLCLLIDINECDSTPCQNGATCNNTQPPGTYRCDCVPGYNGTNCEIGEFVELSVGKISKSNSNCRITYIYMWYGYMHVYIIYMSHIYSHAAIQSPLVKSG